MCNQQCRKLPLLYLYYVIQFILKPQISYLTLQNFTLHGVESAFDIIIIFIIIALTDTHVTEYKR